MGVKRVRADGPGPFLMESEMHRGRLSRSSSKRMFRKTGSMTHKKNMPKRRPMRGGIRL